MRALVTRDYGAPLEVADVPQPEHGRDQVLVRVGSSSVNGFDVAVAAGYLRAMMPHTFPAVLGKDFAGRVQAVGADVVGFAPGDAVFGVLMEPEIGRGSIAEFAVANTEVGLTHRPAGVDVARAGALALAGGTAHSGLAALNLGAGDTLLVFGATGGVGSLAVQLARSAGVRVLATYRDEAGSGHLRSLGVEHVIDAGRDDWADQVFATVDGGVGAAFHLGGDLDSVAAVVRLGGKLATAAARPEPDAYADRGLEVIPVMADVSAGVLHDLAAEVAAGRLDVPISTSFSLEESPAAFAAFGEAKRGKIGLTV